MNWDRFKKYNYEFKELEFGIDISRVNFPETYYSEMQNRVDAALENMDKIEKGAVANPDEGRMVGHYWLRNSSIAPDENLKNEIEGALFQIKSFVGKVHSGEIKGTSGVFSHVLIIGIGGSALGPQFVNQALMNPRGDKMDIYFLDNTDPDGIALTLSKLDGELGKTLSIVISKSGSTPETRNGMLEAISAYENSDLKFADHAVAITGEGSKLSQFSKEGQWLEEFPMWDWVGGRTSELSAVGLLPAALQGIDIDAILQGASDMDLATRNKNISGNPAMILALMWHYCTNGKGDKDMVILPYKDRLMLFSRYLQQLIMESLGKELDLDGKVVHQGIAVYGNKGSTDQHAYVQQLRDGVNNFFAIFIDVLNKGVAFVDEVEPGQSTGDFLNGFYLGTREALSGNDRESITLTIENVSANSIGQLIALFERAVGFYADFVNINAYHQPGVEAGKKAAVSVLSLKTKVWDFLKSNEGQSFTTEDLAEKLGETKNCEIIYKLLENMLINSSKYVSKEARKPFFLSSYKYNT